MEKLDEIDLRMLGAAYESWFDRHQEVSRDGVFESVLRAMLAKGPFDGIPDFEERIDRLEYFGLLLDEGHTYLILPEGCAAVEQTGTAPAELCAIVKRCRVDVLEGLGAARAARGIHSSVHYSTLASDLGIDANRCFAVLFQLQREGLVDEHGNAGLYQISQAGLVEIRKLADGRMQVDDFARLSKLEPHPRGRQLQKYLASLIESQGWRVSEGPRTATEELDVVVSIKREYYVIECKWEKSPCEAEYVQTLKGKLANRADVRGVLVSMSGFSKGALREIRDFVSIRIILPFGPGDVESLVQGDATFENLLEAKYHRLVVNRVTVVDGNESR